MKNMEKEKEYKGIKESEAKEALANLGKRMFDLFDKDEKTYRSGNRGLCIMWLLSFTASLMAREAIDLHIVTGESLENSWIKAIINDKDVNVSGYSKTDLELLIK